MLRHSKYERGELDNLASMTVEYHSYAKVSSKERATVYPKPHEGVREPRNTPLTQK